MRLALLTSLFALAAAPPAGAQDPDADDQVRIVESAGDAMLSAPMSMASAGMPVADLSAPPDFEGVLEDDDPTQQEKPYDAYSFPVQTSNEVTVTMNSDAFDTYLIVRAPSGREWTNDDYAGTTVSQVSFIATEAGEYTIWATAYRATGRGPYQIRVSSKRAVIVSEVQGRLDYEDEQLIKGEFVDRVSVRAPDRGEFYVEMMPLGFSGFVRVTSPSGESTRSQSAGNRNAIRIGPLRGVPGSWTVDVTTLSPGEVGAYDLRVLTLDEQ